MTKMKAIGADLVATKARPAAPSPEPEAPARKVYVRGEPMNFRVSKEFKRAFKSAAANHDLKMNELLVEAFDVWLREKGG